MSTDDKTPLDRALDLFVFAPLGIAITARDALPELIEKGRQQATAQVTVAKMMGQFAVQQGRQEAERAVGQIRDQAEGVLSGLGVPSGSPGTPPASTAPPATPTGAKTAGAAAARSTDGATATARPTSGPGAAELAIPDYDSLSASQVVPRLAGLSPEELEAVRGYEAAHRGRKTILNRVAQLQTS